MSPLADRRVRVRSEIIGRLFGTLEFVESVRVKNISSTGALIESSMPAAIGSLRSLQLTVAGQSLRLKTCVRSLMTIDQERQPLYAIGVEFVSPPENLSALIASFVAEAQMD